MVDEEHGIIDYLPHYEKNCMKTIIIKPMGIIKKKTYCAILSYAVENICRNLISELHQVGILVSRILHVSGKKSGHFQIVAINPSKLGLK